jgi:hypothetical protein
VKIPSDLVCIIESIRDMSVDISCRKASRCWRRLMYASDFAAAAGLFIPPPCSVGSIVFSFLGSLVYNVREQHSVKDLVNSPTVPNHHCYFFRVSYFDQQSFSVFVVAGNNRLCEMFEVLTSS